MVCLQLHVIHCGVPNQFVASNIVCRTPENECLTATSKPACSATGDAGFRVLLRLVSKKIYKMHEKALGLSVGESLPGPRNPEAVLPAASNIFVREAKPALPGWP